MIEIELPCCGATAPFEQEAHEVHCEECAVTLEFGDTEPVALPLAA